jgi:Na+/H+ antiporter NhaD/arsenite permease-like protein
MDLVLAIFVIVYVGMAFGQIPGLRVDRTGAALLGAIALVVSGETSMRAAWNAIDYQTITLLFGLMIVSGTYAESGFYTYVTQRMAALRTSTPLLLAVIVAVTAGLSSLLTNDVIAVAMAPLLVDGCQARRLNPVPFLLGLGFGANAGSIATIIGSPQNMIIGQQMGLSFTAFMVGTAVPAVLAAATIWVVLLVLYRGRWDADPPAGKSVIEAVPFDRGETIKVAVVTFAVLAIFVLTDWPRDVVALAAAGVLLMNRRIASINMLRHVNGDLLILLVGLFVVNAALAQTHLPDQWIADLRSVGFNLHDPLWLFLSTALASDVVGNTPAVMLLVPYAGGSDAGVVMAVASGLSSNLVVFGSLATIIVADVASRRGIDISFWEFTRAGAPITVLTMVIGYGWIWLLLS